MITVYNEAILGFFRRLRWGGRKVPVVYAGPDRAHGQMREYMAKTVSSKTGAKARSTRAKMAKAKIPYPFVSVFLDLAGFDPARYTPFVHRGIVKDKERGVALSVQDPRPENFTVQADVWCGDNWRMGNSLVGQIKSWFNADDTSVFVNFADPKLYAAPFTTPSYCKLMGKLTCRLTDEGVSDNSTYEGATAQPKEVRKTFSGTLYGWLPRVPYEVKLVHKFVYTVEDDREEPPVVLETVTINLV
jgi:hypothetical protein